MIFVQSKYEWARWFAWYPVSVKRGNENCLVWLQYVERIPMLPGLGVHYVRLPGFDKEGKPMPPAQEHNIRTGPRHGEIRNDI